MSDKKPYDVLVTEKYTNSNGEEKTKYYNCGVAFENEGGGMSVMVAEGISLSGRFLILPRRDKAENAE